MTVERPRTRWSAGSAWSAWLVWPLATLAVLAHLGLGVLAAIEYLRLDWLASEPYDLTAISIMAGSAVLALAGALRQALAAARGTQAVRRLVKSAIVPTPTPVHVAATALGIVERVDVVDEREAFAVTHGLLRPRILLSRGLVDVLNAVELNAVLAHEREHLLRRDPLRLLGARIVSGYGWFLPWLGWRTRRAELRREVAADRAAIAHAGVPAVAGALLKLADRPSLHAVAAANPAGDLPERIAHLEGQKPKRRRALRVWLLGGASLLNLSALTAAAVCCAGVGAAMTGVMT